MRTTALKSILILCFLLSTADSFAESGPGNGTDYVKVLFAEAQNVLNQRMSGLNQSQVRGLQVDEPSKRWLVENLPSPNGRWSQLKFYMSNMRLAFQNAPCEDSSGRQSSICFFNENPEDPYVLISVLENKNTTPTQAMAMLIHEAGHFTGEMDHLFLDKVGVELVQSLFAPRSFAFSLASTEFTANIFQAKRDCDTGAGDQAKNLREQALIKLAELCRNHGKDCDLSRTQMAYTGSLVYENGVGFTMKVTCELKTFLAVE
jgi:hypothetical protein